MMMIIDNLSGHLEVVVALFEPKVKTLKLHFQSSTIKSFEHMQSEKKVQILPDFQSQWMENQSNQKYRKTTPQNWLFFPSS